MDDKVSVSIEEIENGFLFRRSWCEKGEDDDDNKYHHDEYFMENLPGALKKLFDKGYMKDLVKGDMWDTMKGEKLSEKEEEDEEDE